MSWLFQNSEPELLALAESEFIAVWSALFGGPPAAMIARADMIALMRAAMTDKPAPRRTQQLPTTVRVGHHLPVTGAPGSRRSGVP